MKGYTGATAPKGRRFFFFKAAAAAAAVLVVLPVRAATVSSGDGLTITLDPAAQVSSVTVDGAELVSAPAPLITVRELSSPTPAPGANLLANPSFELGPAGGNPDGWSVYANNNTLMGLAADQAAAGSRSLFFETDPSTQAKGTGAYLSSPVAVTAGTNYRFSAQVLARGGFIAQTEHPIDWQRGIWSSLSMGGGVYVAWFDHAAADGAYLDAALVAHTHTNARVWNRITGEMRAPATAVAARVVVAAVLADSKGQDDALWLDDVSMFASPDADVDLSGSVSQNAGAVNVSGAVGATGLAVAATLTPGAGFIDISGTVSDTQALSEGRALELALRLPVGLEGWRWWDDTVESRTVEADTAYHNRVSAVADAMLPMSLYPLAALEDGSRGLAASMALDVPRVVLLSYHGGVLEARFHLGISPMASRPGAAASFVVRLYRFDASWGMRAALKRMQEFNPEWFDVDPMLFDYSAMTQAAYGNTGGCLPGCDQECEDCCIGAYLAACHDDAGTASGEHTPTEGYMLTGPASAPPVSYDEALAQMLDPTPGEVEKFGAIYASLLRDANGDFIIKKVAQEGWAPDIWMHIWVMNLDPELVGGFAQYLREYDVKKSYDSTISVGALLDGITFDNFMSSPAIDLDPTRLALADHPLSYDANTYVPGIHTMGPTAEYLDWLSDWTAVNYPNHPGGKSCNVKGVGVMNFFAHRMSILGGENMDYADANEEPKQIWEPSMLRYRRAIAYSKPVLMANAVTPTAAGARRFTEEALAFATHGGYKDKNDLSAEAFAVYSGANDALRRFWHLGWQPVTLATASDSQLWIERYGDQPASAFDSVYFSVHNPAEAPSMYTLSIDAAALGIADATAVVVKDGRTTATLAPIVVGGVINAGGYVEAHTTDLVRLMAFGCRPTELRSASVRFKPAASSDKAKLKGSFDDPGSAPDLIGSKVAFSIGDADGVAWRGEIPAGGLTTKNGRVFKFKDKSGTLASGLIKAKFALRGDGSWKWMAKAKDVDLSGLTSTHVDAAVEVADGHCWADMRNCQSKGGGKKLKCRS